MTITRRHAISLLTAMPMLVAMPSRARSRGVSEIGFARIGGIDQWVAIQGSAIRNPVILFLHGGPANAASPFLGEFLPWEKHFTVANWDQRGSGKTYGKNGPSTPGMSTPEMALDRLTADAIEVAEYVCRRLRKKKVILVGHSWGAILGLHVVKRRPDLFHAFVGTGQMVNWKQSLEEVEVWARKEAMAAGDEATLKALDEAANVPPEDMRRLAASNKYRMAPSDLEYLKIQQAFVGSPPFPTEGDVADWVNGGKFSVPKIMPIVLTFDAKALGLDFPVPVFVIQGRDEHVASFSGAKEYVAEIRAPRKAFVPIEGGHFACFTNSKEFVEALRQHVRPLVT